MTSRRAGLLIPLFSCPSSRSWGIGDFRDVAVMSAWLASAGQRVFQLLPLNEMEPGQHSPYSAITAMAIDPIYIHVPAVPDFRAIGGEGSLDADDRQRLAAVRAAASVEYATVRDLKSRALDAAFAHFVEAEWRPASPRARELRKYCEAQAWWLDDYALYRAIRVREQWRPWSDWPEPLGDREPAALRNARNELATEILHGQYLQWLADGQWRASKKAANAAGVAIFGDLPFMVDGDSADVWANQRLFRLDMSLGVPPDAFSATGQDWGMPVYRWDVIAAEDFGWLRARARRCAELFDGYRLDHLVGFYRTYGRPRDGSPPSFSPAEEPDQIALGERVLEVFLASGAELIAEDLGVVPDFVRASMARLGVPGFRVARWEREWEVEGEPFKDPAAFPAQSVVTSGTHDTDTLVEWWAEASVAEREQMARVPTVAALCGANDLVEAAYIPDVRDVLIASLFAAGSDLLLMPIQDVFGWSDRINVPATVNDRNWTYRLPWPVDAFDEIADVRERRDRLRAWAVASGRLMLKDVASLPSVR
jgi:4-alpha-glucanotransferase